MKKSIDFNYDLIIGQTKRMEHISADMRRIANKRITAVIDILNSAMAGDGADKYIEHCINTRTKVSENADVIENTALRTRKIVQELNGAYKKSKTEE